MYLIEEYLLDAVAIVSASEVSEEEFADAVNAQARLLAGLDFQETIFEPEDRPSPIIQ